MRKIPKPPEVRYGKVRPSKTVPDQSLSIQEIVKRYVRGIPVDVVRQQPVYVDQSDFDLEQLARMDFADKAEFARSLEERAAAIKRDIDVRVKNEVAERQRRANAQKQQSDSQQNAGQQGGQTPPKTT